MDLIFILLVSALFYLSRPVVVPSVMFIPKGGVGEIISYLANQEINLSTIDKIFLRIIGKPQSGWIALKQIGDNNGKNIITTHADFLRALTKAKAALVSVTLIPGETREMFFVLLSKKLGLNKQDLDRFYTQLAPMPDGFIMPDTYSLPIGMGEKEAISYLLSVSKAKHKSLAQRAFNRYDSLQWARVLTVASIVQKEAASIAEMPLVASVIYNRLRLGMPLQMDGTLNYGIYSHQKVTPERIRNDKSAFNTYLNKGLPPYPVCAASIEAIRAAISPAKSDYLYFVLDRATGLHKFSKTLNEHNRNIKGQK